MRFSVSVVALLASTGLAMPPSNTVIVRDVTTSEVMTDAITFAVAADCDLLKCAAVVASAGCIGASIALGPAGIPSLLGCTAGGASAICPCAGCIDALNDFLVNNGICPSD
ncbi:hypothetical protein BJ170DRAFT_681314 [Xylariales sp. AK1849]|nr:hypothetical protein BJ170DRAFT_681314 [Xylariales sp. AK1849]